MTDDTIATIRALEARIAELEAREAERSAPTSPPDRPGQPADSPHSRRDALRLAGAAALGAAGAVAFAGAAAASDIGVPVNGPPSITTDPVRSSYTGTAANTTGFVFQSGNANHTNVASASNAALGGWSTAAGSTTDGVFGFSGVANGNGVFGHAPNSGVGVYGLGEINGVVGRSDAGAAVRAATTSGTGVLTGSATGTGIVALSGNIGMLVQGGLAAIALSSGPNPDPRTGTQHANAGMIQIDSAKNVWLCVADGTPGTWQQIGGPTVAGAFHAVTPGRVYDSRPSGGPLVSGTTRTIPVHDRLDTTTSAVVQTDFVPSGATAVLANVTVVDTIGAGFLTINPGGVTTIGAATINWSATGQILNNGVALTLDANRQLTIVPGGGGRTNVVIDVTGYFL